MPEVKGFVPTPEHVVDQMVAKLFSVRAPRAEDRVLDPGCGPGAFIDGVLRWCDRNGCPAPEIVGIDSDPAHIEAARKRFAQVPAVTLLHDDFLIHRDERFDFVIGNPPYVSITGLSHDEKARYKLRYRAATGRFDLYLLFFEQALGLLKPEGRLVFITPEKFLYVQSADILRKELAALHVEEIDFIAETTFGELTTYPVVTTVSNRSMGVPTRIILRDGQARTVQLNGDGTSWLSTITGRAADRAGHSLADACLRISCGVATGADAVYVIRTADLAAELKPFAYPTIAGREISATGDMTGVHSMLVPYSSDNALLGEAELGALGQYLNQPAIRSRLMQRTCISHKPWFAFHENPPLTEILRPKILCKDITSAPCFLMDEGGAIVPRHSVYYLVPNDPSRLAELCAYLNSESARSWLLSHCQRAANGFLRLQSHVLKLLPIPAELAAPPQLDLVATA